MLYKLFSIGVIIMALPVASKGFAYPLKCGFSLPNTGSISHDAAAWLAQYSSEKNRDIKNQMRAVIFQDTEKACKYGFIVDGQLVTLDASTKDDMQRGTKLYASAMSLSPIFSVRTTKIEVINGDTIDVAFDLKDSGYNPVAINMANEHYPGGGVEDGAAAQEESLFRRSNYHESLDPEKNFHLKAQMLDDDYHIPETGVIYSPNVQVFRASDTSGFAFTIPKTMSFIAVAAYNLGAIAMDHSSYEKGTKEKIRSFLRASYLENHDAVVLGALGCGAFANKPTIVARFFAETLQEEEFIGRFKKVVFAVIDDHNGTNFKPFQDTLEGIEI